MLNNNFIRVITFISIILLFFAVSVYDPSVYAKIQAIEDDSLAQINGESGVTLSLNLTVSSVATSVSLGNSIGQYIEFVGDGGTTANALIIGNSTTLHDGFGVSTNVIMNVGTSGGQTWLSINGLALPSTAGGINIYADNLTIVNPVQGNLPAIGNIAITGIVLGQGVTVTGASTLSGVSPVAMNITGHSGGVTMNASLAAYVKSLTWYLNTSGTTMSLSNIYVYAANDDLAGTTQNSWTSPLVGNAAMSMTMDIGSNGSANGTILAINAPMSASMRVGNLNMGGTDFGPLEMNGMSVTRCLVTIRHLNANDLSSMTW
ncbi:MAG: hypothetical protein ABSC11_00740 [Smithella sp.]|jgi:hypothetical protein